MKLPPLELRGYDPNGSFLLHLKARALSPEMMRTGKPNFPLIRLNTPRRMAVFAPPPCLFEFAKRLDDLIAASALLPLPCTSMTPPLTHFAGV
jgi:hypothetical protein